MRIEVCGPSATFPHPQPTGTFSFHFPTRSLQEHLVFISPPAAYSNVKFSFPPRSLQEHLVFIPHPQPTVTFSFHFPTCSLQEHLVFISPPAAYRNRQFALSTNRLIWKSNGSFI